MVIIIEQRKIFITVEGPYACFTDPLLKAEGTSFSAPTPTAAKGLAERIFWKPEMEWIVNRIFVCNPIRFQMVMRNYQQNKIRLDEEAMLLNSDLGNTQQACTRILKDVKYKFVYTIRTKSPDISIDKYFGQIRDRLRKGQCFEQPYLGTREFVVSDFREGTLDDENVHPELIHAGKIQLGNMPLINTYESGEFQTKYFNAVLDQGILDVTSFY